MVLPAVLAFCALAMLIYTGRGLRYAPQVRNESEVVGSMPVYYMAYGAAPRMLAPLACLIMLLLPLLMAAAILMLLEVPGMELTIVGVAFWGAWIAAAGLILVVFVQTWRVLDQMDRDIALRTATESVRSSEGEAVRPGP